jgi:hypothetical protein
VMMTTTTVMTALMSAITTATAEAAELSTLCVK